MDHPAREVGQSDTYRCVTLSLPYSPYTSSLPRAPLRMASRPSLLYNADNTPLSLSSRMTFSTSRPARSYAKQAADEDNDDPTSSIPYVTDVLSYPDFYVAVNTENIIKFLDRKTLKSLREIRMANGATVRSIAKMKGDDGNGLLVTFEDGSVGVYDTRESSSQPHMTLKGGY